MKNVELNIIHASKVYELLELMRRKPYYLTSRSITALQNFLNGYLIFDQTINIYNEGDPSFDDFRLWLLKKGGWKHGNFRDVLLGMCNGSEEIAFEKFFELLDQFKEQKNNR